MKIWKTVEGMKTATKEGLVDKGFWEVVKLIDDVEFDLEPGKITIVWMGDGLDGRTN